MSRAIEARAPFRFAEWMSTNVQRDRSGREYRYHPRSPTHSRKLSELIKEDLLASTPVLGDQYNSFDVRVETETEWHWPSGRQKTLDLGVGVPESGVMESVRAFGTKIISARAVLLGCEAKSTMTEHGKSKPRLFDELSSSHDIIHRELDQAIAAGIHVVNIANRFVSPLTQKDGEPLVWTKHTQPAVASDMVDFLRSKVRVRLNLGEVGFDAFCIFVVDCDNQGACGLWEKAPAPRPGDPYHYESFLRRLAGLYEERFSDVSAF